MKQTKTKVLLTLLVAVAMMLFAVPAFAADLTVTKPADVVAYQGQTVTFSVTASGGTPDASKNYTYQWEKSTNSGASFTTISGATNSAYSTALAADQTVGDTLQFRCVVTDSKSLTATSEAAKVTVKAGVAIATQPAAQSAKAGASAHFYVVAKDGSGNYSYQWKKLPVGKIDKTDNWVDVAGDQTCTVNPVDMTMNGDLYKCVVTDTTSNTSVTSGTAALTVTDENLTIKTQPKASVVVNEGTTPDALTVVAQGATTPYTYKWEQSTDAGKTWTTVGTNSESYAISAATVSMNGYQYRVTVTSGTKSVVSDVAKLTVNAKLRAIITPNNNDKNEGVETPIVTSTTTNVENGKDVTLTTTASGGTSPYLKYQWYKTSVDSANAIKDATTSTLTIKASDVAADTVYFCQVYDSAVPSGEAIAQTTIKVSYGSITSGTVTGTKGTALSSDSQEFTVTLPSTAGFKAVTANDDLSTYFTFTGAPAGIKAVATKASAVNSRTISFKFTGTPTETSNATLNVIVNAAALSKGAAPISITTNDKAKFNITTPATAAQFAITGAGTYDGKAHAATVEPTADAKDGVGAVSNIRYYTTDSYETTTVAPTEAGTYHVVFDVADGTVYSGAKHVTMDYTIAKADKVAIEKTPDTYYTWTKSAVYNGKTQSANVAFANGITKGGNVKVYYTTTGTTTQTTPVEIGKYDIYVYNDLTAATDKNFVAMGSDGAAKIGTFEITKTQPTSALFTTTPTEATYTGSAIPVEVKLNADVKGMGVVSAPKYYDESGKQLDGAPTAAGKYTIKVDIAEGDSYAAVTDLTVGTLTINATAAPSITYSAHVQNIGWQTAVSDWAKAGTESQSLRMEAIEISVPTTANVQIKAEAHVQNYGWMGAKTGSDVTVGTTGESLRMEALRLQLTGTDAAKYQIKVKAHIQNYGWTDDKVIKSTDSFENTAIGTTGESLRMEAIKIIIEPVSK